MNATPLNPGLRWLNAACRLGLLWGLCAPAGWAQPASVPTPAAAAAAGLPAGSAAPLGLRDVPFPVMQLGLEGVTVFEPEALFHFAMAVHAREEHSGLSAQALANAMAQVYREDGYPLAEVSWRAEADSGQVVWTVDEGHITDVTVGGLDGPTTARVLRYLEPLKRERPLRQASLERALALAGDLAGLSLSSRLAPMAGIQGSALLVDGESTRRRGGLVLETLPVRPGYSQRLYGYEERYGLLQAGDLLRAYATATRDPNDGSSLLGGLQYRAPVGSNGDYVEVLAGNSRAERGLSNTLDRSELRGLNASLAWGLAFQRDFHRYGYWIAVLDHADAKTEQVGRRPRSQASAARLYLVQGHTTREESLVQYSLTLSAGARPGSATDDGERSFQHLRAGLGLAGPWRAGDAVVTYRFEAAGQWTDQRLPQVEHFVLGHFPYLRGYAPAEVAGDRGAGFTLEAVRHGDVNRGLATIRPFAFVSAGYVELLSAPGAISWSLASVGAGLRTTVATRWGVEAWVASPLRNGPLSRRGDPAFFLSLSTSL